MRHSLCPHDSTRCSDSVWFFSKRGHKHIPPEAPEQKSRQRMDFLSESRVVPGDWNLSGEIKMEHSVRQQVEHEPKTRQPIRRLKVEIKQQPTKNAKDLSPPHPPPHQIAQPGSVVGPHPRHPQLLLNLEQNSPRGYTTTNHRARHLRNAGLAGGASFKCRDELGGLFTLFRLLLFRPPSRRVHSQKPFPRRIVRPTTPRPIACPFYQFFLYRILMHVRQFFFQFCLRIHVEVVVAPLPESPQFSLVVGNER